MFKDVVDKSRNEIFKEKNGREQTQEQILRLIGSINEKTNAFII